MHDVYEVSKLLKYSVQIESITVYGNSFHNKLVLFICLYLSYQKISHLNL